MSVGPPGRWAPAGLGGLKVTIATMKVSCAECGCVVEAGVRVVPCGKRDCCCQHLPVRA
jgi:hypothetical protein